jgi:hypothetical protein
VLKAKLGPGRPVDRFEAIWTVRPNAAIVIDEHRGRVPGLPAAAAPPLTEPGVTVVEHPHARDLDAVAAVLRQLLPPHPNFDRPFKPVV